MQVQDLRYCKVCLVTDVKMYSMNIPSIRQAYSQLVQIYISEAYQMYICYECVFLLRKYQEFRAKCIRALHVLSSINMDHTRIPKEIVRIVNRQFYNLDSKLEWTSILQCNSNDQYYVLANNENLLKDNLNTDLNIRPDINSDLDIRPDINSDLNIRPDINSDLNIRPDINSDLDIRPGINSDLNIRPDINSDLNIRPDINSDLDIRPGINSDLNIRPDINSDLDIRPDINSDLDIRLDDKSDLNIRPDINSDFYIKPDVNSDLNISPDIRTDITSELDIKPDIHYDLDVKPDINFDIDVKPDINFDLDIKLDTPKIEIDNEVSSEIIVEPKYYVSSNSDASYNMPDTENENTTTFNTEINQKQNASYLDDQHLTNESLKCERKENILSTTQIPEKSILSQKQSTSFSNEIIGLNDQVSENNVCVPKTKTKQKPVAKKSTTTVSHSNRKQNTRDFRLNYKSGGNYMMNVVDEPASEESLLQKYKVKDMTIVLCTTEDIKKELLLRKDSSNYNNNPFKCDICYKGFGLISTFNNHMKKHNPENGSWECEHCHQKFRTNYVRNKHKLVCHTYKFCCTICPYVCASSSQARVHNSLHEGKKYTCNECEMTFSMPSTLATHKHTKHRNEVVCGLCGSMFATAKGLCLHMKLSHKQESVEVLGPKCEECDVQFATETAFKRHLVLSSKHTVRNGCEYCGETFDSTDDLNVHLKNHPQKLRFNNYRLKLPASCKYCGTWLNNHSEYQIHMRSQHPFTRVKKTRIKGTFICDECGTSRKTLRRLHAHQFKNSCKQAYKCLECKKEFKSPMVLWKHENIHTRKRVFQCDVCQKEYLFKNALVKHIKAHFGIRPYPCPVCDKTFMHRYEVKMHTEYVHHKKPWPKRDRSKKVATEETSVL